MRHVHPASSFVPTQPFTWVAVLNGPSKSAMIMCDCWNIVCLERYEILPNGMVVPEVECDACGHREQVQLVGWAAAA